MALTNTQRSRNLLRKRGYVTDKTEHWNHHAKVRQDMFGFVDVVAVRKGQFLLVQSTSWGNVSHRRNKIHDAPATEWLLTVPGIEIWIHGWRKKGSRWEVKEERVSVVRSNTVDCAAVTT